MKALILLFVIPTFAAAPTPQEKQRQAVIVELQQTGFFKRATCQEVASTFLERAGLPVIGQKTPVKGTRGNFNRDGQNEAMPVFSDEITIQSGEKIKISSTVVKKAQKGGDWNLRITRAQAAAKVQLVEDFSFVYDARADQPSCHLVKATFASSFSGSSTPTTEYSIPECIDIFAGKLEIVQPANAQILLEWLKADCTTGMHYWVPAQSVSNN